MSARILLGFALIATFGALLVAVRLKRYRRHWHFALWNREFHRRANYAPEGRNWLIAFEVLSLVAFAAWVMISTQGK